MEWEIGRGFLVLVMLYEVYQLGRAVERYKVEGNKLTLKSIWSIKSQRLSLFRKD